MSIVVKNLIKLYGQQRAVDDISFEVHTGQILGFLGPNGAGKTTTMKVITTFLQPNSGSIEVGGLSVQDFPLQVRKNIGYLPENNPLYEDITMIDYLKYVAALQDIPKKHIHERVQHMISVCGLNDEMHKKIAELSKGYRQRVGLAQALIHDPKVLILDEPTTGLDPNQIAEIRELIRTIGKEKTVILSSHILAEVEATCDRIMIINKGKIVADGTPDELRQQSTGKETLKIKIEDGNRLDIHQALHGLSTVESVNDLHPENCSFEIQSKTGASSRREIFQLCLQNGWVLTELTPIETKLEDVFRELTINGLS